MSHRRWSDSGFDLPLLIGGATTSKAHTAIKIEPAYSAARRSTSPMHRGASVLRRRCCRTSSAGLRNRTQAEYEPIRARSNARPTKRVLFPTPMRSPKRRQSIGRTSTPRAAVPRYAGAERLFARRAVAVHRLVAVFHDLGTRGKVPEDSQRSNRRRSSTGGVCRRASDARRIIDEGWISAHGAFGFWRANVRAATTYLFDDAESRTPLATLHHLRQQSKKGAPGPHFSLADFVAPTPTSTTSADSPSTPAPGSTRWSRSSKPRTTTTTRSW